MKDNKLVVVVGPTAVGKTAIAIELAEKWQTEIISADSRQIFKELQIGTAKPSQQELNRVTHHFINYKSIEEEYDARQFGEEALAVINTLFERLEVVILCGGSGLYVKSLLEGFDEIPQIPKAIREEIIKEYEANGLAWLQNEMERLDAEYFQQVDRQNPHRLIRGVEINRATGKPVGTFRSNPKRKLPFKVIKIGLELPREVLYQRIDDRMDVMIGDGLFEEAERFYPQRNLNALQTVGYREIFGFMEGAYDREEAIRLLKRNSRNYAKRQLTWFKKDKEIQWMSPEEAIQNSRFHIQN
jgi:tRNA dimethylallyltransferase